MEQIISHQELLEEPTGTQILVDHSMSLTPGIMANVIRLTRKPGGLLFLNGVAVHGHVGVRFASQVDITMGMHTLHMGPKGGPPPKRQVAVILIRIVDTTGAILMAGSTTINIRAECGFLEGVNKVASGNTHPKYGRVESVAAEGSSGSRRKVEAGTWFHNFI